ncbi:MAG: hypothetical protein R2809_02090 [Flavobacteriales bacterium]
MVTTNGVVGGYIGFDAANGTQLMTIKLRIVTMKRADYDVLNAEGLLLTTTQ